jgi:biopolymer transport protein ExbD
MSKRGKREELEPNLTPLIDIVFLLLIFFIVSSVFKSDELKMMVTLPKTISGESFKETDKKDKLIIEVKKDVLVFNGENYLNLNSFEQELLKEKNKLIVELRGDSDTSYGKFIDVFDILKRNKFLKINLITKKRIDNEN